jgi:RHS repeat-associated protein
MKEPPEVDWLEAANFTGQSTPGGALGYVNRWYRKGPPGHVGSLTDYVARFYSPALGRFVSADTIVPGAGNPQAYNRYMYVLGRVNNLVDPSGHCAESDQECIDTYNEVQKHLSFGALYLRRDWDTARLREFLGWMSRGVRITQASGSWSTTSLQALLDGLNRVQSTLGQRTDGLLGLSNGLMFVNDTGREKRVGNGWLVGETTTDRSGKRIVTLYNNPVSSGNDAEFTIVHEIGHVVHMGLGIDLKGTSELYQTWQRIHDQPGQPSRYAESNLFEDYAETFAWNAYYQTWSTWSLPLFRYQTPSSERREALMVSFDYLSCEIP